MDMTSQYLSIIANELPQFSVEQAKNIFAQMDAIGAKNLEEGYTREEYIKLIGDLRVTTVGSFAQYKMAIKRYVDWLVEQNALPAKCSNELTAVSITDIAADSLYDEKYYRNFNELDCAIKDTLNLSGVEDWMVYGTAISALYLAWCGVKIEDAVKILRNDVHDDHILVNGDKIYPNQKAMYVIRLYMLEDGFTTYNKTGAYTRKYKKSKYLFRTYKSPQISKRNLTSLISQFSVVGGTDRNYLSYEKVYKSGLYNMAYQWEISNRELTAKDFETLSKLFKKPYKDPKMAYTTLQDYKNFKKFLLKKASDS